MAYQKYVYNRINWVNKSEALTTPLGKTNLNRMDGAIKIITDNVDEAFHELDAKKFNESNASKVLSEMPTWNPETGILNFKFYDGTVFEVDFNIEKIPVSFSMDENGVITMTTADGTEWTASIGDVIPSYLYADSDTVAFSKTKTGEYEYKISAEVKRNSLTEDYFEPNYLSEIKLNADSAAASAQSAADSASDADYDAKMAQSYSVGGTGMREGEDADNAKHYKEQSQSWAVGATGKREGEDENNSKYWSEKSEGSSEASRLYALQAENAVDGAIDEINEAANQAIGAIEDALETNLPKFSINLISGHLEYQGGRFAFLMNHSNGHLEWEVA